MCHSILKMNRFNYLFILIVLLIKNTNADNYNYIENYIIGR